MENESKSVNWQDWTLVGLRVLFLLFAGIILFTYSPTVGDVYPQNEIVIALVIGLIATIFVTVMVLFPTLEKILPVVLLIGDWVVAGIFTYVSHGNPTLIIANAGLIMISTVLRVGIAWGIAESIGVFAAVLIAVGIRSGSFSTLGDFIREQRLALGTVAAFAVAVNAWGYILQRQLRTQERAISDASFNRAAQIADMHERTRAIYDMAAALSSTLDYHKILEAAMAAGWLGLRRLSDKTQGRLVSAVLLFHASDNQLHVEVGRGLARTDDGKSVYGEEGIIGDTLEKCIPIVMNGSARKDPELGNFVAFQSVRSVLCIPLRAGFDNYGIMVYGSELQGAFTDEHTELLTAVGTQATVALQNAVLYQNLLKERDKIVEVEEEARKKLARDLHDGPTQSVAAIAMRMSIIYKMLERTPDEVPAELKKIEEIARNTTKEIRSMLFTLRPLVLENQGLTAALGQLAEKMQETYNQAVSVWVAQEAESALDSHAQGTIFYIIEEAVGNARKHAQAPVISVSVNRQEDVVIVNIADNGVGFDAKAAEENAKGRGGHLGMINLHERAELLGGSLRIESAIGKGSSITVIVPITGAPTTQQSKRVAAKRASTGDTTKLEAAVNRMWAERADN